MPIGDVLNGELYFVAKDGTEWSTLGTVTDMEILEAPGNVPTAHITTILSEPIEFSAALDTDESWRSFACLVGIDRLQPYQEELLRRCMNKKEETHMKMSEKMALRLHLMMWGDMKDELGDTPNIKEREDYKSGWTKKHFPGACISAHCFLCEFTQSNFSGSPACENCPIKWPHNNCTNNTMHYANTPISKILALPARNPDLQHIVDEFNRVDKVYQNVVNDAYIRGRDGVIGPIAEASGLPEAYAITDHIKAIRAAGYNKGAEDVIGQLDAAFKRGTDEAMEKILKGEIQSDTTKKLEQKGYNRACEDICKEAGVPSSHNPSTVAYRIKDEGWFNCKKEFISTGKINGVTDNSFCRDILARYKNQVIEEYKKEHPETVARPVDVDIDRAFKQYADEAVRGVKEKLAKASGLSANDTTNNHIKAIRNMGYNEGYANGCHAQSDSDKTALAIYSKLPDAENHWIYEHAKAIYDLGAADARKTMEEKITSMFKQ